MMKLGIYLSLLAGLMAQFFYASSLPAEVAVHFGQGGYPNGWLNSEIHQLINSLILIGNSIIFLSVNTIFKRVPMKYISFPNKEYWLAEERKNDSMKMISNWMAFFGLATNLFLLGVFHLVYLANQVHPPRLNEDLFLKLMGIYSILLIGWLILLFKKFNKTKN